MRPSAPGAESATQRSPFWASSSVQMISEDDPAISVSHPQLEPASGGPIGAYAAAPREIDANTPGVVVVHHVWGVDAQIRDVVRRFAKAGFVSVAPLLYARFNPPSGDGATDNTPFAAIAQQMVDQGFYAGDLASAYDSLHAQAPNGKIGIMGFCLGGTLVLEQIIGSDRFSAAAMFYGDVQPGMGARFSTPLLGNFGARDTVIEARDVRAMFAQLNAPHDVKIYDDAGHAFFDDTRVRYVATAAEDAWQRTLAWFDRYLKRRA